METRRVGVRPDRLGVGDWIMGVASLALLIDVFLPWYSGRTVLTAAGSELNIHSHYSATQAYHLLGPYTLLCALFGLIVWGAVLTQRTPALPLCLTIVAALLDLVLVLGLLLRVVFVQWRLTAPGVPGTDTVRLDIPAVVGLFLAAFMLWGVWLTLRTDGIPTGDSPWRVEALRLSQRRA
jgi:hypothetical protein